MKNINTGTTVYVKKKQSIKNIVYHKYVVQYTTINIFNWLIKRTIKHWRNL